ncbi:MAG: ATP synthase F1 subunit gamma [Christensenellales bacterium]|jgi:F-type H+-transporting ATPase subunit gamma
MSSMKAIKQRITNVSTTKQIMKAMDMVSSSKFRKARRRLEGARPLYKALKSNLDILKTSEEAYKNVFTMQRPLRSTAYIIITSDKGLCGSYNINICEKALEHMNEGKNERLLVIGSKGSEYFKRRDKNIMRRITGISEAQIYEGAGRLADLTTSLYVSGEVDEIFIAYTYFESPLNYIPRVEKVLPITEDTYEAPKYGGMGYEPDVSAFLDHIMPLYLHAYFFAAASEAVTCEHASRMVNMESASKNASDIIEDLNRMYNRKRQATITQELNEIVSGANILK